MLVEFFPPRGIGYFVSAKEFSGWLSWKETRFKKEKRKKPTHGLPPFQENNGIFFITIVSQQRLQAAWHSRDQKYRYLSRNQQKDFWSQELGTMICLLFFYWSQMVGKLCNQTAQVQILPPRLEAMWPSTSYLTSMGLFSCGQIKLVIPSRDLLWRLSDLRHIQCLEKFHLVSAL